MLLAAADNDADMLGLSETVRDSVGEAVSDWVDDAEAADVDEPASKVTRLYVHYFTRNQGMLHPCANVCVHGLKGMRSRWRRRARAARSPAQASARVTCVPHLRLRQSALHMLLHMVLTKGTPWELATLGNIAIAELASQTCGGYTSAQRTSLFQTKFSFTALHHKTTS